MILVQSSIWIQSVYHDHNDNDWMNDEWWMMIECGEIEKKEIKIEK